MSLEEFKMFIESIGFESKGLYYHYKEYVIYLYNNYYHFFNGSEWTWDISFNDLTPLKQIERSYKLKKILG